MLEGRRRGFSLVYPRKNMVCAKFWTFCAIRRLDRCFFFVFLYGVVPRRAARRDTCWTHLLRPRPETATHTARARDRRLRRRRRRLGRNARKSLRSSGPRGGGRAGKGMANGVTDDRVGRRSLAVLAGRPTDRPAGWLAGWLARAGFGTPTSCARWRWRRRRRAFHILRVSVPIRPRRRGVP